MSPPFLKSVYFWESFGQVVLPGNGPNPHGEGGWRQPWPGLPVAGFRLGRGWVCAKASVGGLSFPQNRFSLEKQVLSGGSLQEAVSLECCSCLRDSVWLWALQSECRLDGSCARSSLAQPRPAQRQVLRPHRVQAPGPGGRALGEGVMRMSDLTGGSSLWDWMGSMWLLFPFKLDSGWESFLSGGSQLPRCCNLFSCFCREVFFLSSSGWFFFCHQKNTYELCVVVPPPPRPPDCDLTSVDS